MATQRTIELECATASGSKTWKGIADGSGLTIRFGKTGANLQVKQIPLGECKDGSPHKELIRRSTQKLKEGYRQISDVSKDVPDLALPPSEDPPTEAISVPTEHVYFEPKGTAHEVLVQATLIADAMGISSRFSAAGITVNCLPAPLEIAPSNPSARVITAEVNTQAEIFLLSLAATLGGVFSSDTAVKDLRASQEIVAERLKAKARAKAVPPKLNAILEEAGVLSGSWAPIKTDAPKAGALHFDI